jgi:hypothetical protein
MADYRIGEGQLWLVIESLATLPAVRAYEMLRRLEPIQAPSSGVEPASSLAGGEVPPPAAQPPAAKRGRR